MKGEIDPREIHIDTVAQRKLIRKVDFYVIPLLNLCWIFAYLDRSNIGNAAIAGMPADLHMSSQDLANAILMFYVTYVPFELPGSLLVKKVKPSRYLPLMMLGFSATCLGTGFMTSAGQMYASRLLIGLFEASMYPALAITLTTFYTPQEQARRFAFMYLAVGSSGGFGGLFAYGILQHLDGAHGIAGWRWLFIIEGTLSVGLAVLLWLGFPDNWQDAKFLNEEEKELMRLRTAKYHANMSSEERFDKREVWKTFKDFKIWISSLLQFLGDVLSFGVSTFMPSIVKSLGFDSVLTQLLVVPIFFWAVAIFIGMCIWSDKLQKRYHFMLPAILITILGYALLSGLPMSSVGGLYFANFLIVPGIYIALGMNYVSMLNNHGGYYKRATAIGINMTCGNSAGLVIAQIFKDKTSDGRYLIGLTTSLGCAVAFCVAGTIQYLYLRHQNKKRDALTAEERQRWIDEGATGDYHPDFRYML
ncbi:major facilitator superfamily transporter [Thozetella sp. PMI_491]|nr:major facilitator superfamily transporter [Thozetella sp. PMI_491]